MRLVLGSNISSLQAQRRLGQNSFELSGVFERLTTGQRINKASDDAAGLAVEAKLSNQSRVFKRASLNVSDATSLLSITDGALGQVNDMLTRMAELATQAANGSLGSQQRRTLDKEFAALDKEIKRITSSTKFNGIKLFQGSQIAPDAVQSGQGFTLSGTLTSSNGRFVVATSTAQASITDTVTGEVRNFAVSNVQSYAGVDDQGNVFYKEHGSAFFGNGRFRKYDYTTETTLTLTNEANVDALGSVTFSADGTTVAFASTTNYTDGQGIESASGTGVLRLYVMDLATGIIRTNGQQMSGSGVRLSSDGTQVALISNSIGSGIFLQSEIISATYSANGVSNFQQRTNSSNANTLTLLGINSDGKVTIDSRRDFTGQNPNAFRQIFSVDSSGVISQASNFSVNVTLNALTVDLRGSAVYFVTNSDLTSENPSSLNQLFMLDLDAGGVTQITNYSGNTLLSAATALSISADGRFVNSRGSVTSNLERFDLSPGAKNYDFEVGQGTSGGITAQLESIRSSLSGLGTLIVSSQSSAGFALDVLGDNISALSSFRGRIGASLSRLEIANSLLNSQVVEINAATSRIRDADIAFEAANLTRLNILQNAASAVLAQANQQPALALTLLSQNE
jgi:flagellin